MSFLKIGFAMPYRELEKVLHANQHIVKKYTTGIFIADFRHALISYLMSKNLDTALYVPFIFYIVHDVKCGLPTDMKTVILADHIPMYIMYELSQFVNFKSNFLQILQQT